MATPLKSVPIYNAASSRSRDDPTYLHPTLLNEENRPSADPVVQRKGKKNQQRPGTRAELIPGHRGDQSIDDMMNFINQPSKQKK